MIITALGTGSSSARWPLFNASLLIRFGEQHYLVDCGGSVPGALHAHKLTYDKISGIILTHLHGGHANGIEEVVSFNYWNCHKKTPIFVTPPMMPEVIKKLGVLRYGVDKVLSIADLLDIRLISSIILKNEFEEEAIRFIPVPHVAELPTYGLHFEKARLAYFPDARLDLGVYKRLEPHVDKWVVGCSLKGNRAHASLQDLQDNLSEKILANTFLTHYEAIRPLPSIAPMRWLSQGDDIYKSF